MNKYSLGTEKLCQKSGKNLWGIETDRTTPSSGGVAYIVVDQCNTRSNGMMFARGRI